MRVIVCVALALTLAGCAPLKPLDTQPVIRNGTTVIAIVVVPAGDSGCRAKVSRDRAKVRVNKPVVWEVVDLCNEIEQEIHLEFDAAGGLKANLKRVKDKGKVRRGQADYLQWDVNANAKPEQYADYGIFLGTTRLEDPRIEVPRR
jgi:hypothetical protein